LQVDFRNTIVIMTSNVGASEFAHEPEGAISDDTRGRVQATLQQTFPPEFLNRIDEVLAHMRRATATVPC
jgi:ATP-dependent Clp protease ATP-binding subunit ClpB